MQKFIHVNYIYTSNLYNILHKWLDFGLILQQIKGSRNDDREYPIINIAFVKFGSKGFGEVVDFLS